MLARLYCFLCDFVPRGLRGLFDHIGGDDVMGHMLCSDGDTAPSRHRFSKDAQAAWFELDTWMKKGKDWQEAREQAKTDYDSQRQANGSYQKTISSWKAPGLLSPAGMVALLAIFYPEKVFKLSDRISKL